MTRTRGVSLHGNTYLVDPSLVGRRVELRYDPEDLTKLAVWYQGQPVGDATPEDIKAHVDPKLRAADPAQTGPPTGIAYLQAVAADHAAGVAYHQPPPLAEPADPTQPDADGQSAGQQQQQQQWGPREQGGAR